MIEPTIVEPVAAVPPVAIPLESSSAPEGKPRVIDCGHDNEEAGLDEGLLMARLSALVEQVRAASCLQADTRNSWLEMMEVAETGVADLLEEQVGLKVKVGKLEDELSALSEKLAKSESQVDGLSSELRERDSSLEVLGEDMEQVAQHLKTKIRDLEGIADSSCALSRALDEAEELAALVEELRSSEAQLQNQLSVNQANMVELEKRCECLASEKSALE
uniref:Uncharacterized protein n=1 Tax=Mesocestoides corti TaxID=53468 RepID=A0A5K3G204_MESCO